jgi:radical SAM superfamily enzyme YgiQ (UPF0313 family)
MSLSPVPRWDLVKIEHYARGMVQASRGCLYDCEFCDVVSLFGRGNRYKPLENIMKEIEVLVEMGQQDIFIADDNLIGNRKYVRELLNRLIQFNETLKFPVRFSTQLSLDVAKDEELLDLLKQANFPNIFIGIETPNEKSLILTDKKHNLRMEMKEAIRQIQSRGIYVVAGMIVGFDTDGPDIFQLQSEFLTEAGITCTTLGILVAIKGTKLWNRMEKEKRLILEAGKTDPYTHASQNFTPKLMAPEELKNGYIKLIKNVYSAPHFLKRFQNLIDQIDLEKVTTNSPLSQNFDIKRPNFKYLKIALRVVRFYIFNKNKKMRDLFWSTLGIALKKGRVCFPLAINSLVFFNITKEFMENNYSDSY